MKETALRNNYVFFWKEHEKNGYLSNWYPVSFQIDGHWYRDVEQYFMAEKAKLFQDSTRYHEILNAHSPSEYKRIGRQVFPFDPVLWDQKKYEIMKAGNRAKYLQNPDLMAKLLATGDKILAEASPFDKIWGIGMDAASAAPLLPSNWPGQNLLGKVLMEVRLEFMHIS